MTTRRTGGACQSILRPRHGSRAPRRATRSPSLHALLCPTRIGSKLTLGRLAHADLAGSCSSSYARTATLSLPTSPATHTPLVLDLDHSPAPRPSPSNPDSVTPVSALDAS